MGCGSRDSGSYDTRGWTAQQYGIAGKSERGSPRHVPGQLHLVQSFGGRSMANGGHARGQLDGDDVAGDSNAGEGVAPVQSAHVYSQQEA